jgi:hypothetical protein
MCPSVDFFYIRNDKKIPKAKIRRKKKAFTVWGATLGMRTFRVVVVCWLMTKQFKRIHKANCVMKKNKRKEVIIFVRYQLVY